MTGFGRGVTTTEIFQLTIEIRSVNHRFLEIHTRFPKEWMEAEIAAKKILSSYVSRGKLDVTVYVKELENLEQHIQINWSLIDAYKKAKEQLKKAVPIEEKWTMRELLEIENALIYEKQQLTSTVLVEAVESAVSEAVGALIKMREREGQELHTAVLQHKMQLEEQIQYIRKGSIHAVQKYRERLTERIHEITTNTMLDDRILAEVGLFAERADITEELDRLDSHFVQLTETLEESGSIGRKLDFLMQEMHREINTIGSKNQSSIVSVAVVEAKTILEKMREQVQNIE